MSAVTPRPPTASAPSRPSRPHPPVPAPFPPAHGRLVCGLLLAALLGMIAVNVMSGEAEVAQIVRPGIVLRVIGRHIPLLAAHIPPLPDALRYIDSLVWEQRLPRAFGGALVGMLLAMAGVAFQSLLRNPLADPYMVGVSAGSALGSVVVILLGGAGLLGGFAPPLAAFLSGMLAMVIVSALSRVGGRLATQTFLLAGVVVGTFFWSLIPLILSLANRSGNLDRQSAILSQLLGSLQNMGWSSLGVLLILGLIGAIALGTGVRELDIMAMGEESAAHLGVNTEAFKRRVIVAGSLVTAAAVSVAGIVAFVGLVMPHIARRLVGPRHAILLPAAMLLGGLGLVIADWLSRVYLGQLEIGVITSLLGGPFFLFLLRRRLVGRE